MSVSKGSVIAGRYRAERRVGAGGMGEVWEGEHLALGSRVAIKTLLEGGEDNAELVARFRREAKLLGRVRSDHVARVVDFVEDPEAGLVLIMEYVEGRSLAAVLEHKTLDIDEGLDLAIDLATALADLHKSKIVHRDIKPGNIIMQPTSVGSARAVLVDFGISRIEGRSEEDSLTGITRADMALGTVEYMAPEQILNSRQVTSASDVYAVGAILFRALCGRHVFGDRRDEALARAKLIDEPPSLSIGGGDPLARELCAVVDRALKKRPAQRFSSGEQMLDLLLPIRQARRGADLDEETTTDGDRTIAREVFVAPRASLPSISSASGAASSSAVARSSDPDPGRRSHPSIDLPPPSEMRPRMASLAGVAVEPPRARLPWGPLMLALATAFAVGAAVAVAVGPQPLVMAELSAPPSVASAPAPADPAAADPVRAAPVEPCPTVAAIEPTRTIDLDEPLPPAASPARPAGAMPKAPAAPATAPSAAPTGGTTTSGTAAAPTTGPRPPTTSVSTPPRPSSAPASTGGTTSAPATTAPPPSGTTAPAPTSPPSAAPPPERPRPPVDTELF